MNKAENKRVLIVGAGFTGTMTAVQLLRSGKPVSITLFDASKRIARGIAYDASSPEILLNVPAIRMSPIQDEPSAFIDWARANRDHPLLKGREPGPADFLSRGLYGSFLEHLLKQSLAANTNAKLEIVEGTVTSLSRDSNGWRAVGTFSGPRTGDFAVLALGNPPPTIPAQLRSLSSRRLINPWAGLELNGLNLGDSVVCIGSGLTAVDIVVRLTELGYKGKIHLCSRHGLLPNSHLDDPLAAPKSSLDVTKSPLRPLVREIRRRIGEIVRSGGPWQTTLDTLRPQHQEIWRGFSLAERARFARHLSPYWEIHRHRVAPQLGRLVQKLKSEGRLKIHAGSIQNVNETSGGVSVTLKLRGSKMVETIQGSHMFLCTGPARTVAAWQSPLIEKLLTTGDLVQDDMGFGFNLAESGSDRHIFLLGSALRGTLWETTAARELALQALSTAQHILTA